MPHTETTAATPVNVPSAPGSSSTSQWSVEPSLREVLALWLVTCIVFVTCIATLRNYFALVDDSGDCSAYMAIASAIRHWNFHGVMVKQFWACPTPWPHCRERPASVIALLLICFASSAARVFFAYRLWGGWVAGFFAILNFDWMQRSYLGGSEPLFVALLF